jgi:hypothetical protein
MTHLLHVTMILENVAFNMTCSFSQDVRCVCHVAVQSGRSSQAACRFSRSAKDVGLRRLPTAEPNLFSDEPRLG